MAQYGPKLEQKIGEFAALFFLSERTFALLCGVSDKNRKSKHAMTTVMQFPGT